jgi:hypothetical protein
MMYGCAAHRGRGAADQSSSRFNIDQLLTASIDNDSTWCARRGNTGWYWLPKRGKTEVSVQQTAVLYQQCSVSFFIAEMDNEQKKK